MKHYLHHNVYRLLVAVLSEILIRSPGHNVESRDASSTSIKEKS